uniref:Uncharacterized protein n=1 Tax=Setaria italica TaxID=4555 RepID=K3YKN9_SETIT
MYIGQSCISHFNILDYAQGKLLLIIYSCNHVHKRGDVDQQSIQLVTTALVTINSEAALIQAKPND